MKRLSRSQGSLVGAVELGEVGGDVERGEDGVDAGQDMRME